MIKKSLNWITKQWRVSVGTHQQTDVSFVWIQTSLHLCPFATAISEAFSDSRRTGVLSSLGQQQRRSQLPAPPGRRSCSQPGRHQNGGEKAGGGGRRSWQPRRGQGENGQGSAWREDGGESRGKIVHVFTTYLGVLEKPWKSILVFSFIIFILIYIESSSQIKKEKPSGDGCKGEPMDTSSSSVPSSVATGEDKKPEVKKEPKEEEEGSGSTGTNSSPASAQSKKKSKFGLTLLLI